MATQEKTTSGTDLAGRTYGQLTVLGFAAKIGHFDYWKCKCSCGNERDVRAYRLMTNRTKSCGCLRVDLLRDRVTKHGAYQQAEYGIYCAAKVRCTNPKHNSYKYYGERGIEFRFDSYESFLTEVGKRPTPKHSIDRIDVNGHYEIGNVRWATATEQMANRRPQR